MAEKGAATSEYTAVTAWQIVPVNIDSVIRAEIPGPEFDLLIYDIVKITMIHSPCGNLNRNSLCIFNGLWSKIYPRQLSKDSHIADDAYLQYLWDFPLWCILLFISITVKEPTLQQEMPQRKFRILIKLDF